MIIQPLVSVIFQVTFSCEFLNGRILCNSVHRPTWISWLFNLSLYLLHLKGSSDLRHLMEPIKKETWFKMQGRIIFSTSEETVDFRG